MAIAATVHLQHLRAGPEVEVAPGEDEGKGGSPPVRSTPRGRSRRRHVGLVLARDEAEVQGEGAGAVGVQGVHRDLDLVAGFDRLVHVDGGVAHIRGGVLPRARQHGRR